MKLRVISSKKCGGRLVVTTVLLSTGTSARVGWWISGKSHEDLIQVDDDPVAWDDYYTEGLTKGEYWETYELAQEVAYWCSQKGLNCTPNFYRRIVRKIAHRN
jgi:hypothetical protein